MMITQEILQAGEQYATSFIETRISKQFAFHDILHTREVVRSCQELSAFHPLEESDQNALIFAAWFHDLGYCEGPEKHEERSFQIAKDFLAPYQVDPKTLDRIHGFILATRLPQQPNNLLEQLIADADLSHLGKNTYWDRCSRLRQEMALTANKFMNDEEWLAFEIRFMTHHHYHTEVARTLYEDQKKKYIKQLLKQQKRLIESQLDVAMQSKEDMNDSLAEKLKFNEQQINVIDPGRGVETMFRTTYRTHINLSSMADSKANIMLSINSIILSIIISTVAPWLESHHKFLIPAILMLLVCLSSIVFATLATKPKITQGKFSREDVYEKKANLLFFGNFFNMPLPDYHWGMMEMIKDSDYLYSSMTKDLYFLGKVLAQKYRYLSYCYQIFMYGLVLVVLSFLLVQLL